jgi:hypothetical protein
MAPNSRLRLDPSTNLPSIHTFGDLSNFLRGAVADEDSRQFSESMGHLAVHIEAIIAALRVDRVRATIAPMLVDLLTVLRGHRNLIVNLGLSWRGLYEYANYLQALNNFRVLIGQWLLDGPSSKELFISAEDFQMVAWRTLGEGMLLIDMYDQWLASGEPTEASLDAPPTEPMVHRAVHWWSKLGR